jgi:SAM-dependent methyltransferase
MPFRTEIERELRRIWSQLKKTALRARIGQRWSDPGERGDFARRVYPDYDTYLKHQRLKVDALRVKSLAGHDRRFYAALSERLGQCQIELKGRSVLCLAARLGTEVRAFHDQGAFAVGIDLNPGRDNRWVVVGDFHALQFADASVDVVYTNSLDHVYDIDRVMAEVRRVLKPDGVFLLEVGRGSEEGGGPGFYEALAWPHADALIERIVRTGFRVRRRVPFGEPWQGLQVALEKGPCSGEAASG